jgi:hypothetical protein
MTILRFEHNKTTHNFIWAPKCSGTNLYRHLRKKYNVENLGDRYNTHKNITHYPFSFFEEKKEVSVDEINFTIIRDPFDRLQSFYKTALKESYFDLRNHTIEQVIELGERHRNVLVMPHSDRIPKNCSLYHINHLQDLEHYLNVTITETQHNKSDEPKHIFTDKEIHFIHKYYEKDFELIEREKYQRDDNNKISHLNYNFDKNELYVDFLKNYEKASPYEDYRKKLIEWKIVRYKKSEYVEKICKDLDIDGEPRFYILDPYAFLPQHLDHGTQCSINIILSEKQSPVSFMGKEFYYDACLLNTQLRHGVKNGSEERLLFKLSIRNESYDQVREKLQRKGLICIS